MHTNHLKSLESSGSPEKLLQSFTVCLICHTARSAVMLVTSDVAYRVYVTWHRCYGSIWNRASKVEGLKHNFGWEDCVMLMLHSKAVKRQSWCFELARVLWNHLLCPHYHASTCALIYSSLIQQKCQVYLMKHEVNQQRKSRGRWIIDDSLP